MGVINFYTGQPGMAGPKKTTQEYIVKKKKKKRGSQREYNSAMDCNSTCIEIKSLDC